MLNYLRRFGLSEMTLFGDIPGLAAANTIRTPLQRMGPIAPEQNLKRGNRAYQSKRYEDALAAYRDYAAALPDVAQPHCLIGDALAALGHFEEAKLAYTRALENLDRPINVGEHVIVEKSVSDLMSGALYYNRGNVHATTGAHRNAVADFNQALLHGHIVKRDVLYNRGNSKFVLKMVAEAYQDFEAAWLDGKRSDAALAMGNCKVMMGEFEDALTRYLDGVTAEPEKGAKACLANSNRTNELLEALYGRDYRVSHDEFTVLVETDDLQGGVFPYTAIPGTLVTFPPAWSLRMAGKATRARRGLP